MISDKSYSRICCLTHHAHYLHSDFEQHGPLTRNVKLWAAHAPGMPWTFSPPPQISDPDMHHGTYVKHIRDRLLAVFFEVDGGENVPGILGACSIRNFTYLVSALLPHNISISVMSPLLLTLLDYSRDFVKWSLISSQLKLILSNLTKMSTEFYFQYFRMIPINEVHAFGNE